MFFKRPPGRVVAGAIDDAQFHDGGFQQRQRPAVAPGRAAFRGIGLQQDACLQCLPGGRFTPLHQRVELCPLIGAELDDVSLDGRLFRGHDTSPGLPEVAGQRSAAESTTQGTRPFTRGSSPQLTPGDHTMLDRAVEAAETIEFLLLDRASAAICAAAMTLKREVDRLTMPFVPQQQRQDR